MSYNIEGIINPRDILPVVFKKVLPLYVRDYGKEYVNMILRRLYDTVYIFDSNPIDTWNFICEHSSEIKDQDYVNRCHSEYVDFVNHSRRIDANNDKALRRFLKKVYQLPLSSKDYSVMNVDFDSYSVASIHKLHNGTELEKKEILDRQGLYRQQCRLAGINPITVPTLASELSDIQRQLIENKKYKLIERTKWAYRIREEIKSIYGFDISIGSLKDCLFDEGLASTTIDEDKKGFRTIMTFPIIHDYGKTSLDHVLFHELRHVVETGNKACGFYKLKNGKYQMINEIHTDKNALLDAKEFENLIFLGKSRRNKRSYYERFFPYLGDLFEDYKMSFDLFGFINRPDLVENLFGERFLKDLEYKLHNEEEFKKGNQIRLKRNV